MLRLSLQYFAHKKGMGSTKNGRDSESKRLGPKRGTSWSASAAPRSIPEPMWARARTIRSSRWSTASSVSSVWAGTASRSVSMRLRSNV